MVAKLKYLSDTALDQLRKDIEKSRNRYRGEGFADLADDPAWDISLGVEYDDALFSTLDQSTPRVIAAIDFENSRVVGRALQELTPALANEERVWVRLAHLEGFNYSRSRWLDSESDANLSAAIETHMFAATQTRIRDDHALSRLWWNYRIAKTCMPDDPDIALNLILKSADIRSNFVERIWMTSRQNIASAVLRAMQSDPWVTEGDMHFRAFMKTLNKLGGGIVFEALDTKESDGFVADCVARARA